MILEGTGLSACDILLPKQGFEKWAVVACDQFTSQPGYWSAVEDYVGVSPSTLRLMLPEAYLEHGDTPEREAGIVYNMKEYLSGNVYNTYKNAAVYVQRKTESGVRHGLVAMIDLEEYDYRAGSESLVRATEETIASRLPARVQIRLKAPLEMPHIMMLINDHSNDIIKGLQKHTARMQKLYGFELMMGGGRIEGYLVDDKNILSELTRKLNDLKMANNGFLYAMGDGNHSLAAAKECWNIIKKDLNTQEQLSHPARYALAEIVNLYDDALKFESIHRVLFGVRESFIEEFSKVLKAQSINGVLSASPAAGAIEYVCEGKTGYLVLDCIGGRLPVAVIQKALDEYLDKNNDVKIDYVHGDDVAKELAAGKSRFCFIMPAFDKKLLFDTVVRDGALPRKSFSMGHAHEKRYYLECRKIQD